MRPIFRNILIAVAVPGSLGAIEPPVESQPIPPQAPPVAVPAPLEVARPVPVDEPPLAMPQAGEARPYLGVILDPVPELLAAHLKLAPGEGVVIGDMVPGGPADHAGLTSGDILLEVAGTGVGSAEAVRAEVERHKVGDEVEVWLIQQGEHRRRKLVLGQAPEEMAAFDDPNQAGQPLEGFLEGLPDRHADVIREALQKNLRAFEELEKKGGDLPERLQRGLMRRLEQEMGAQFSAESTIRLADDQGSIEMTSRNGHKEVRVFDESGKSLWEGPYDTEQDRAAVPDGIRERLEKLNIDMDFNGNGMRLHFGPDRFRPLEELDKGPPEDAPAGE